MASEIIDQTQTPLRLGGGSTTLKWTDVYGKGQSAEPYKFDNIGFEIINDERKVVETLPIQGKTIFEIITIGARTIRCKADILADIPKRNNDTESREDTLSSNLLALIAKYPVGYVNNFKVGYVQRGRDAIDFLDPQQPKFPNSQNPVPRTVYSPISDLVIIDKLLNAPLSLKIDQFHLNKLGINYGVVMSGAKYDIKVGMPGWITVEFTLKEDSYLYLG